MADDGLARAAAVRKGSLWTAEEDSVLEKYIKANGEGSWNMLARAAGLNRTGRSCRRRWLNHLRPDLRRDEMTAEEKDLVLRLHSQWGNRWSKIAKELPGRTAEKVMEFWRKTNIQQQQQVRQKTKKQLRQHGKVDITAAGGSCSSGGGTPATTEGQEGSSSNNNSGQSGGGVVVPGGGGAAAAFGTTPGAGVRDAVMDMDYFFFRDLLAAHDDDALNLKGTFYLTAAPGKYLDFWSTSTANSSTGVPLVCGGKQ